MVDPKHQHQGISSNLIAMVVEVVKGDGIKMLSVLFVLRRKDEAADFYREAGFYPSAEGWRVARSTSKREPMHR